MKKFFKKAGQVFTGAAAAVTLMAGRVMAAEAGSASNPAQAGANTAKGSGMPSELVGVNGVFTRITNTVLYAVGIISVIMLIYGGLRYVISGGDSKKVTDVRYHRSHHLYPRLRNRQLRHQRSRRRSKRLIIKFLYAPRNHRDCEVF